MAKLTNADLSTESFIIDTRKSPYNRVSSVPIGAVKLGDGFWKPRMEANRLNGIPALLQQLEAHGAIDNFRRVSGRKAVERQGPVFTDSDVYKWMEGAALVLATTKDPAIKSALDGVIDEVVAAQQEDGYLNTYFWGERAGERFTKLESDHELYCAGHMFQAAIAHHRATGETKFYDCALRLADYLTQEFGPGKIEQVDGHAEVEMALTELYRATGKTSYLDLAGFLINLERYEERKQITGHAVRDGYIAASATDYYAETGKPGIKNALDIVWKDMSSSKVYITGGLGARYAGEAMGDPFELPNENAYAETCATIANAMWSFRLLGVHGQGQYADMLETSLYNGFLSGVSLDTTHWFYMNPLGCFREYQRSPWHGCTCCPTNVVRTLAAIPGYMYGVSNEGVWVHLYDDSTMDYQLADGRGIRIDQKTHYPWDGGVRLTVAPQTPANFSLYLRVPGWNREMSVEVNGEEFKGTISNGYLEIRREWKADDVVALDLKMPVEMIEADPRVIDDAGRIALTRGPIVFCVESPDNLNLPLRGISVSSKDKFEADYDPKLLGGVVKLSGHGEVARGLDEAPLYRPLGSVKSEKPQQYPLVAIPYYAWANRGISQMQVWIPVRK